jgi:hypothetical protein
MMLGSLLDYKIVLCRVSEKPKAVHSQISNTILICNDAIFWWIPFVQVIGHKHPKRKKRTPKKKVYDRDQEENY